MFLTKNTLKNMLMKQIECKSMYLGCSDLLNFKSKIEQRCFLLEFRSIQSKLFQYYDTLVWIVDLKSVRIKTQKKALKSLKIRPCVRIFTEQFARNSRKLEKIFSSKA